MANTKRLDVSAETVMDSIAQLVTVCESWKDDDEVLHGHMVGVVTGYLIALGDFGADPVKDLGLDYDAMCDVVGCDPFDYYDERLRKVDPKVWALLHLSMMAEEEGL